MTSDRPTLVRWRILGLLIMASFASYVLRSNLSLAAPTMVDDLGLSWNQWGVVMAAFMAGYAIFQFPGGLFCDRFGPRLALALIAVVWGLLTIATALVPGPESASTLMILLCLVTVRFLVGALHAPIYPITASCIQRWFPAGNWALPNGLSATGLTLGFAATVPVLTWLVIEFGWRISFLILSPVAFVMSWIWWQFVRDYPHEHHAVNAAEVALIESACPQRSGKAGDKGAWLRVLRNRDIVLLTLSYSCMGFVFWDVFNYFFSYLVESRGLGEAKAGLVTSSQWIAGGAGAALGGWICDRLCRRIGLGWGCRLPVIVGMLISGVLLIGGAVSTNPSIALWMFIFCFFFNQLTEGGYWAAAIAVGGSHAGAAGGVMNTGNNVSGVINALMVPVLATSLGWDFAIGAGGIFAFLGAGLMMLVRADRPMSDN
ncbi:MAG: MFS transporter [Proteobacteria bacterium]|nr:MFS transporter [Pseudomonadota bacterium]MDA0994809.1 MFS transporter [Pseudomonadota bacterium]